MTFVVVIEGEGLPRRKRGRFGVVIGAVRVLFDEYGVVGFIDFNVLRSCTVGLRCVSIYPKA